MRICHVIESSSGGSAQVMADLIRGQLQQGDEVTLIYSPLRADPLFLSTLEKLLPVNMHKLSMRRSVGFQDLVALVKLFFLLRKEGPFDVIHSHSSKAGGLTRLAGVLLPQTIQIYSPHGFVTMMPGSSRLYRWMEHILGGLSDVVITVSPREEGHALKALGLPRSKVKLVLNGIALGHQADRVAARGLMMFGDQDYVVGFVGRLVPEKNPLRLIETFRILAAKQPDIRLAIVGDGPLRGKVMAAVSKHGLSAKVRFLIDCNARDLMPGFDCLLCASDAEAYALVFPEALDAGLPIVATPVGIAEEAIIEGQTGYVSSFNPEDLAEAVLRLANLKQTERKEISKIARQHAQKFSVHTMNDKTRAVYAETLANRGIPCAR